MTRPNKFLSTSVLKFGFLFHYTPNISHAVDTVKE